MPSPKTRLPFIRLPFHVMGIATEFRFSSRLIGIIGIICLLACKVSAARPADVPANFPDVQLPSKARGEAAITALGAKLPAVAAFYNLTEQQLRARLRQERDLWVDQYGRLLYVCVWPIPPSDDGTPSQPSPMANSPAGYPYEQTFLLHSRPGSSKIIYLDFDGHDASATSWGSDAVGRPFDLDGDPSTFSNTERDRIQYIWLRVAEDFALYDIDVTTQDPGVEALRKTPTTDTAYGIRVVIGGSSGDWFGSAGGVAYVGSFNSSSDLPCWVWPGSLSSSEKNIAEATSHEVGHTLGLSHDGADIGTNHTEYYSGHANWAPVMGVGYSKPIVQWSRGEYANANQLQDDLTVMLSYGAAYRPDDHGNSLGAATALNGVSFDATGNIERTTDVDFFSFNIGAGRVAVTATPAVRGANLHIQLSLYDSAGNLIIATNTADNATSGVLPVTAAAVLPTGIYYVSVEGIGTGSPLNTGYSDYASLGQYTISGTIPGDSVWLPTPPGNYSWTNTANWASNSIPIGANAIARINNNIAGDQLISLDLPVTLGGLHLGDADSSHAFTLQNGAGGPLTFDSGSGNAFLTKINGANDNLAVSLVLKTNLTVTNASLSSISFAGPIVGGGSLIKRGSGSLNLSGTNGFTGSLIIGSGTVVLADTTSLEGTKVIDVQPTGILDLSPRSGGLVLGGNQPFKLTGAGTVLGSLSAPAGTQLAPGTNGVAGTLALGSGLTLNDGAKLSLDLANSTIPGAGTNDLLTVAGDLTLSGTVLVDFNFLNGFVASPGTYTLINYVGALNGGASNLIAVNYTNRYVFAFDDSLPGQIRVQISGNPTNLVWLGDGLLNRWDIASSTNWSDGSGPTPFYQLDNVTFDDVGNNLLSISLVGPLQPASVLVNASKNYTFVGTGRITGPGLLTKQGSGVLTLSTSNDFTGATTVSGGRLQVANAAALGSPVGGTTIGAGATLDLNALSLGAEPLTVQGAGSGSGALMNGSATAQTNAVRFVTLSGDTTFGGTGRWDIRANPTASLIAPNFSLTKTNANDIWIADAGTNSLGDINVQQGMLVFEGSTTLGNPTNTLTIASNANVGIWNTDVNALSKKVVMNGGALHSLYGDNLFTGNLTLNGSNIITSSNIFSLQTQISGPGGFRKLGAGILGLSGANNYTGTTWIAAGTLQARNSSALGVTNGGTTILAGGRLDINGINLGAEPVTVTGTGLGNAGAIINNGASQQFALRFVTLSGNTTFGGIGRWDIRANPTASLVGNNFALTKIGPNEVWLVDAGTNGLANITINEGLLGIQGSTTLGNSANTVTINSAGSLGFYVNGTNVLNKVLSVSSGRIYNGNGSNVFAGTGTLTGSNTFDLFPGTTLVMSGVLAGTGSIHNRSNATLILSANNSYSGPTLISAGTVQFGNGGSSGAPGTGNITNFGTLLFNRTNSFTIANQISRSGSLRHGVVDGANPYIGSVLTLSGNNTYSGATFIFGHGNMIAVGSDTALGTGTLVFSGNNNTTSLTGLRSANASVRTIANNLQLSAGSLIQFGAPGTGDLILNGAFSTDGVDKTLIISNANTTINNPISGSSRIIKNGPGTLILAGNNSHGATVINLGVLRIDSENRLGLDPLTFTPDRLLVNGGTLQTTATFAIDDSNRGISLGAAGGTFDVAAGTTLTLANVVTGVGNLTKVGPGTLELAAVNTYSGATTNNAGDLVVNGLLSGSMLEMAAGTLSGSGTITAPVLVEPAATVSPGSSIGKLTISNTLTLAGTTLIELNKTLLTNDLVAGISTLNYGGTLILTNLDGELAAGDNFKVFDAAVYGGAFTNIVPSVPGTALAWDLSSLTTVGTVKVRANLPQFNPPSVSGGLLTLSGSNGPPDGTYYILASTNIAAPQTEWIPLTTNVFDGSGNFSYSTPIDPAVAHQFYRIQLP